MREEHGHEAEQDHHPQRAEKVRCPVREVVLALAGEQAQRNEYAQGEEKRLQHNPGVGEGDDDGDGVSFHGSEAGEEEEVGRVRLAFPEGEAEEDEGADQRHPHERGRLLNEVLVRFRHHREGADGGGCEELDGPVESQYARHSPLSHGHLQDGVDLTDKGHPDVQCRLCHNTAKLEVIGQVVVFAAGDAAEEGFLGVVGRLVAGWRLRIGRRGCRLVERVALRHVLIFGCAHRDGLVADVDCVRCERQG